MPVSVKKRLEPTREAIRAMEPCASKLFSLAPSDIALIRDWLSRNGMGTLSVCFAYKHISPETADYDAILSNRRNNTRTVQITRHNTTT